MIKRLSRETVKRIGVVVAVAILLSSAIFVVLYTNDVAAASTKYSYTISKDSEGKTIVTGSYNRVAYSSTDSKAAIQWAIDHAFYGNTVLIKYGRYVLSGALTAKSGVTLAGQGDSTVLVDGEIDIHVSKVTIKSLRLEGGCHVVIASKSAAISEIVVQDVSATTTVMEAVFSVIADKYRVSKVSFIRDTVTDSSASGFKVFGTGPISDITFDTCKTIRSGLNDRPDDWVVGFALDGTNSEIKNIKFVRCEASYCWESGFFITPWIKKTSVVLRNCVANYNGQKPLYEEGYGFLADSTVNLINCNGVGNKGGLTNLDSSPSPTIPVVKEMSNIELTASYSSVQVGDIMHASGTLTSISSSESAPINGATVSLSVTLPDGTTSYPVQGSQVVTGSDGVFSMDYASVSAGTVIFIASYAGDDYYEGTSTSVSFSAVAPAPEPDPTPDPSPSSVTLTLATTSLQTGNNLHVDGLLKGTAGISGATVSLKVTLPDGSTAYPTQGRTAATDSSGKFSMDYVPTVAGTYKITVTFAGNAQYTGSSASATFSVTTPVPDPSPSSVTLTLATTSLQTGNNLHVDGLLKGTAGISGATVSLKVTLPDGSTAYPTQGRTAATDSSGKFSMDYVPTVAGTYKITVTFAGNAQYTGSSASATFSAVAPAPEPEPTPDPTLSYDYLVSSNVVKNAAGNTVYTGSTFTAALQWACNQPNKVIYVPAGNYELAKTVQLASGITLCGDGPRETVFTFTDPSTSQTDVGTIKFYSLNKDDITLKNFGITGAGVIEHSVKTGTHGGFITEDVDIWDTDNKYPNAFGLWVSTGATIDGATFLRCNATNVGGCGFVLIGNFPWYDKDGNTIANTGLIKNVLFENCKAMYCGFSLNSYDWTVGFDLFDQCYVQDITLNNCEASYNWESGYHFEYGGEPGEIEHKLKNVVFNNCIANYNGQSYSDPRGAVWGCGWLVFWNQDVTLNGCTGVGNAGGKIYKHDIFSDADKGNGYDYLVNGNKVLNRDGTTAHQDTSFTNALKWACQQANKRIKIPAGTYNVDGQIIVAEGVTVFGALDASAWWSGYSGETILNFGTGEGQGFLIHDVSNVRMSLLRINNGNIEIIADGGASMSNIVLRGITVNQASSLHPAAIYTYCASGSTIDGLDIGACKAVGSHTDGFRFSGDAASTTDWIKNLKLWFCEAENSGKTAPRYDDSVGFRFADGVSIQTVTVFYCDAEYSYSSGFYFVAGSQVSGVSLTDCTSSYNGQKGDATTGTGYRLSGYAITTTGCTGTGNAGSLLQQ